jgi:hypothetical protein
MHEPVPVISFQDCSIFCIVFEPSRAVFPMEVAVPIISFPIDSAISKRTLDISRTLFWIAVKLAVKPVPLQLGYASFKVNLSDQARSKGSVREFKFIHYFLNWRKDFFA